MFSIRYPVETELQTVFRPDYLSDQLISASPLLAHLCQLLPIADIYRLALTSKKNRSKIEAALEAIVKSPWRLLQLFSRSTPVSISKLIADYLDHDDLQYGFKNYIRYVKATRDLFSDQKVDRDKVTALWKDEEAMTKKMVNYICYALITADINKLRLIYLEEAKSFLKWKNFSPQLIASISCLIAYHHLYGRDKVLVRIYGDNEDSFSWCRQCLKPA